MSAWFAIRVPTHMMATHMWAPPAMAPPRPHAATTALTGAERLLWEASDRALRQPTERAVLVLHLSRLAPPAPRPHHIRVARVLLQDSAARFDGQVFAMRNQDLVLLCTSGRTPLHNASGPPVPEPLLAPDMLPATLARLFAADVSDPAQLTSLWRLDRDASHLQSYLADRAGGPVQDAADEDLPDGALSLAALEGTLAKAPLADLLLQQTGMLLSPERGRNLADRLTPAFRALDLSLAALNLRQLVVPVAADPFLLRHLASGLDGRLIQLLAHDLATNGRLTRPSVASGLPIHIELGLEAILSPGFARLCHQAAAQGVRFGACVSVMQACADLDLMEHASRVLKLTGGDLVVHRVDPCALGMVVPASLQPDLLKLVWSPSLISEAGRARPGGILAGIDPARTVLQEVDSQFALAWAQANGIAMVQGPLLDQIQAATRMAGCHSADACSLRQCSTRGSAVGLPGRVGCGNPALLEAGAGPRR